MWILPYSLCLYLNNPIGRFWSKEVPWKAFWPVIMRCNPVLPLTSYYLWYNIILIHSIFLSHTQCTENYFVALNFIIFKYLLFLCKNENISHIFLANAFTVSIIQVEAVQQLVNSQWFQNNSETWAWKPEGKAPPPPPVA